MARSPAPPAGIYAPCVTFFKPDLSLDIEAIKAHALRLAEGGCAGLVIQGSNGEAVHLDHEERSTVLKTVRSTLDSAGHKIPLIAGCGTQSEKETLLLIKEAKEAGAAFTLVLPPHYWSAAMSKPNLVKYFKSIADQSPLPVVIYNFPLVANGINIDSETMLELAQHPNIVGCKLTCGNLGNLHRIAAHTKPEEFAVMSGKGEFALHGFTGGASGCIAALANLAPRCHVALYKAFTSGDHKTAKSLQDLISDADLAQSKLGVAGLKLAVSTYFGYGTGKARSPLPDGSPANLEAQKQVLDQLVQKEKSL